MSYTPSSLMLYLLFAHPKQNKANKMNARNQSNYHFHASMENSNPVNNQTI